MNIITSLALSIREALSKLTSAANINLQTYKIFSQSRVILFFCYKKNGNWQLIDRVAATPKTLVQSMSLMRSSTEREFLHLRGKKYLMITG